MFLDLENYNYNYNYNSPCIDSGDPTQSDPDGSIRDIGANIYSSLLLGDCNQDNEQDVIDIVYNMNNCILDIVIEDCNCADMNQDDDFNVLDVVLLVNIILSN